MSTVSPYSIPGFEQPGSCCGSDAAAMSGYLGNATSMDFNGSNPDAYILKDEDGNQMLHLLVENMHCANCIATIEGCLKSVPEVLEARVNFSTRRLLVRWKESELDAEHMLKPILELGYRLIPYDPELMQSATKQENRFLLVCIAVAGFAAANVMLLSISVWAGLWSADMGSATRDMMHWISALIALPAVTVAGQPFFKSAYAALKSGRLNMDVPISLAVMMAAGMSLIETMQHGKYVYFDASVTLLFLLLIGRYLDRQARAKARSAAERLLLLKAVAATLVTKDGVQQSVPLETITPGCTLAVSPGDRIPVDGLITSGSTELDASLVTGESLPEHAEVGSEVFAGTLNLGNPFYMQATAIGDNTLLGNIVQLMENAEQGRAKYVRLADRVAGFYAPAVHLLALATFIGWWALGADWQVALFQAVAVLIITCPCALGLAVPVVQVIASGVLLKKGVFVKSADGLERLATIDRIVVDKTGTLTMGSPQLINRHEITDSDLKIAAQMAQVSRHPLAQALYHGAGPVVIPVGANITEEPGMGLEWISQGKRIRLGNRTWCEVSSRDSHVSSEIWLSIENKKPVQFRFEDQLRSDADAFITEITGKGLPIELLSGDRQNVVEDIANKLGICDWQAQMRPAEKVARLKELEQQGHKVLMIGDGINDAPALAAAYVSMSPGSASDISQTASDFVFQGGQLMTVADTWQVAKFSRNLVFQNFGLAFCYNLIAVPLAVLGFVTPLIAAVAMSSSSLVVTGNSMRLKLLQGGERK